MNAPHVLQPEAVRFDADTLVARIARVWAAKPLSSPLSAFLFAALFVAMVLLRWVFSGFPQNAYQHDIFIFTDGAWRVLHGQRPQIDFNSNLGPLMYLVTAAGFLLTHNAAHAMAVTQISFSGMIAALTAYVAFRRMRQVPAMLVTVTAFLIAICPCNTGEEPFALTYAMLYNRVGFGFLAYILVEATQPPPDTDSARREEFIGGFLSGIVLVLLFFLKFTYAFMAGVLLVGLLPYRSQRTSRFAGMAAGMALSSLAMLAYLGFHVGTIFSSVVLGASAKHVVPAVIMSRVTTYVPMILFTAILAALSAWLHGSRVTNEDLRRGLRRAAAVALVSLAALGLLLSNAQFDGLPLAALMCLIVAGEMIGLSRMTDGRSDLSSIAACLVFVGLLIPVANVLFWDSSAYVFSIARAAGLRSGGEGTLDSNVASDFKTRQIMMVGLRQEPYTQYLNEGLKLLRSNSTPQDRILTLDFVNPFPFLLQTPPATQGTTCLHYLTTFDEKHHLPPDELFGNTTLIMWPKVYEEPRLGSGIERVYAAAVRERFDVIAESEAWRLLRRKASRSVRAVVVATGR